MYCLVSWEWHKPGCLMNWFKVHQKAQTTHCSYPCGFLACMETFLRLHLEPRAGTPQEFYTAKRSEIVVHHLLVQLAQWLNELPGRRKHQEHDWDVMSENKLYFQFWRCEYLSESYPYLPQYPYLCISELSMILLWIWSQNPMVWFIQNHNNFFYCPSEISKHSIPVQLLLWI